MTYWQVAPDELTGDVGTPDATLAGGYGSRTWQCIADVDDEGQPLLATS